MPTFCDDWFCRSCGHGPMSDLEDRCEKCNEPWTETATSVEDDVNPGQTQIRISSVQRDRVHPGHGRTRFLVEIEVPEGTLTRRVRTDEAGMYIAYQGGRVSVGVGDLFPFTN